MRLETISKLPPGMSYLTPLLFVHGAWHGAWCWDRHFLDYFARRGFAAHALSLRGHGQSEGRDRLRWTRLSEYVADVAQVAGQLPRPPVVIGHSMGGAVVQKYLETHPAPAGVLLASVPPSGGLAAALRVARRHPVQFAKMNLTLSLLPLVGTPRLAREAFFSADMSDELVLAYAGRLQDESYLGFLDLLAPILARPRRITTPMLVLGAAQDTFLHPREIDATARPYGTKAVVFPGMAHDMMLEAGWREVAERILSWLSETGLDNPSESQSVAGATKSRED